MTSAMGWAALAVALSGLGCVKAPLPHPRALENNQLCAQYLSAGDLDKADIHCDLGLEFSPFHAELWVNKGLIYLRRDNKEKAKECFIKALRYNQETAAAYNNLGFVYYGEKEYGKAHDNFRRALKVNPDYTEARYNLALTLKGMKKFKEARKEFETVLSVNPNLADPHNHLCVMSLEESKCETAVYHCETATQLDASYSDAWFNLGNAYSDCGKLHDGRDAFTSCLKADPNHIGCQTNLAIINRKIGLLDPSLNEMRARESTDASPQSMYMMAKTFGDKGLKYEEKRYYKKCIELDEKYPLCHFGLYKLYVADQRLVDAKTACRNFLKFGSSEEYPKQVEDCDKFLSSH